VQKVALMQELQFVGQVVQLNEDRMYPLAQTLHAVVFGQERQ
jgi:hypothetical protein